jgi:opacity protein-like surface antigen
VVEVAEFSIIPMVYTANVKGYVLTGPIQPFVLVGAGLMTTKTRVHSLQAPRFSETERDSGFVARFGGGVDFYMTKTLALTTGVDYVRPFGSGIKDLQYISYNVGLLARF